MGHSSLDAEQQSNSGRNFIIGSNDKPVLAEITLNNPAISHFVTPDTNYRAGIVVSHDLDKPAGTNDVTIGKQRFESFEHGNLVSS